MKLPKIKPLRPESKKKLKKLSKQLNTMFIVFVVFISFFGCLYSLSIIWTGFHNMDGGQNMRWLEATYGLELVDITMQGNTLDGETAYRLGTWQLKEGIEMLIVSICFFIASIFSLIEMAERGNK